MNSLRKAAILLMSLPEDEAAKLMGLLSPKDVEIVSIELARLGHVLGEEQEAVINEFADANPNGLGGQTGGLGLAKSLVEKALGKNAAGTLHSVQQQIEALPFGFLRNVDSQNLITFIIDEQPQTIALILSHLTPTLGAEVLAGLPADRQLAVIRRVATMGQTNPEIIREVERGLESRMSSVMSQSFENAGGVPCVAEMLNVSERATERALLENLGDEDPELVEEIRRLMFVFEDISKFSDKDIQAVLKNVESSQWALALKGASDALKEKVLGNLSQRARDM
ncbi:MAG: flagellar motor switch protein FliG, partial [Planctomycetales bacterium]|nr:flagellar motor switch protein FliG [Planctomycetales bacterium]